MQKYLFPILSMSVMAISACSTQGASRYGDSHTESALVLCGTVTVPCGQIVEYHRVQVQPPTYLVPVPCPTGHCLPSEPPVIVEPPNVPPAVAELPYEPPVTLEPPVVEPPIVLSPPPPVSCPPGTIPGYGGTDCIPITVPRK